VDSSVIFLVIIGLWAAYLVPHWLRRCEQLSASRSVDRFSAAMRVLARRSDAPTRERPVSRSYVLMPPREPRDVVTSALPVDDGIPLPRDEMLGGERLRHGGQDGLQGTRRRAAPRPGSAAPQSQDRPVRGSRPRPPRLLPVTLLGFVATAPVLAVLGLVGVVPLWSPLPALGLALALVVTLRAKALQARAPRADASPRTSSRSTASRSTSSGSEAPRSPRSSAGPDASRRPSLAAVDATARRVAADVRHGASPAQAGATLAVQEAVVDPDGWTPVPVPPPTYTLKAHAPRRRLAPATLAPAAPASGVARPVPGPRTEPRAPAFDLDAVLERRRASGE